MQFPISELEESNVIVSAVRSYLRFTDDAPTWRLVIEKLFQSAGTCGANVSWWAEASTSSPNSPRSNGLTTIAADQIWCGELVTTGW